MANLSLRKSSVMALVALSIATFSSCANQEVSETLPETELSEAALLDPSEIAATPVTDDASVFADLNAAPAASEHAGANLTHDDSDPFYLPIGGESLGRVAYTLYGNRGMAGSLLKKNPELQGVKKLTAEQRVYFDMDKLNPQPMFLTKDMLDRYPSQLAEKIQKTSVLAKTTVALGTGETLQTLSQRLYGTTRYWTEIYLLNREALASYDKVSPGMQLTVFERSPAGAASTTDVTGAPAAMPTEMPVAPIQPMPEQSAVQPAAQPLMPDDTSARAPVVEQVAPAPVVHEAEPAQLDTQPVAAADTVQSGGLDSTNLRRILYGIAILLIGGLAFYFTRPNKKKFDMLDMTTQDSAPRPKLGNPKDSHKQGLG